MKILTVYKSGGEYRPEHVDALRDQCAMYAPGVEFICLNEFEHNWPGWWSKMEIFKIPGPVLYLDLSNTIHKKLDSFLEAAQGYDFIVNRDPNGHQRLVQSCVMAWSGDMSNLYEVFREDAEHYMVEYKTPRWWGDQGFIEAHAKNWVYWQDIIPGAVASYKKHSGIISDPVIINYHGHPKPWEVANVMAY